MKQSSVKKKHGRFVGIPYHVVASERFRNLSAHAYKLVVDLSLQRNGKNNGKLSACWTLMKKRGWKSSSTLHKAKNELLDSGFIVVTRRGRKQRGYPTLVAFTWDGIDDCSVDYDEGIKVSSVPLSFWCKDPDFWKRN
ncbi:MAG: hypothetical protein ACFHHU_01865 [Porticoccaceae bacterium]